MIDHYRKFLIYFGIQYHEHYTDIASWIQTPVPSRSIKPSVNIALQGARPGTSSNHIKT